MKRTLLAATLLAAMSAYAQPKPPPAWHQGKPPAQADSKLAPLPGRMTETPASEIPIGKLNLPKGFAVEIWATGMPEVRNTKLLDEPREQYVRCARLRAEVCEAFADATVSEKAAQENLPEQGAPQAFVEGVL